ncbi:hypothetical protein [Wolbachia endosymbiont of Ctenocephalides felis wCfeJ]|uniref:hypothetical protein n=1 Tax=Wolbachia endosymbiont of Ctenocephalides felis wCfeJ TaxID=2732594 RepID=UPI0014469492|nr:hypothetical protein [Wolbachia endosymbiont of Ctenocephalides felis wCfeJ]WCR58151.1 MAG: hypothetical protein PG980_000623 [Wolbachia endosymbiont of Ctenocephalides felis wCfeJ]
MSSGIKDSAHINLDFGTKQITGFPAKAWRATKKYSVNNTLPTVAINTWLQFSSAYVAAVIITSNDVSFITNILSSQIMPAYILASVMLGIALVTFLVIKRIYTQEIKDEKLKDGNSTIDEKIRSGKTSGRSEIVQNALTVEIIPDMSLIGNKKENFSIILPISEKQEETLENKRKENRNKIILLTVPYVLSSLIIGCALAKFGFAYIKGWKEWASIAALGFIVIVGICITLSKFRSNEVNNAYNFVQNFSNLDILLPWRKGSVISVMENKFESKEKDDFQSQILRLVKDSVLKSVGPELNDALKNIKKTIEEMLNTMNGVKNAAKAVENTANKFNPCTWEWPQSLWQSLQQSLLPQQDKQPQELTNSGQRQATASDSSTSKNEDTTANSLESRVEKQLEEVRELALQMESNRLVGRKIKLKEKLSELKETEQWREKTNGKPSEFLYYLLESIRLAGKDSKEIEATLRNFDNRVIIHWKDGSQTICHIKKQGDLQVQPSTKFVDLNMREAFRVARKDG